MSADEALRQSDVGEIVRRLREECPGNSLFSVAADALEKQDAWNGLRAQDIITLGSQVGKLSAKLEQIAIVCTDNMDADCNHRMALDFVRSLANE